MWAIILADLAASTQIGGLGLVGARFDRARGELRRLLDGELNGVVDVDMIGGGMLPMYRCSALRAVGGMDPSLFYAFEDLDLGLRLQAAGYRLVIDGALMLAERMRTGNLSIGRTRPVRPGEELAWQRYYAVRNRVAILRRLGMWLAALRVTAAAGVGRPAFELARRRPGASALVAPSIRGALDAWIGRAGRTVPPGAPREKRRRHP
jgi:hypothetical protein